MSSTTTAMGSFYDDKMAASELRRYREKGPIPSTRALIEALKAEGVEGATLLDIGGGIGAIQHELLDACVARATCVDASAPYLEATREEARRRGHEGRVTYLHGDFVDLADSIPPAEIVTRDRVLNLCPGWERLTEPAAAHAERLSGLVYPRDTRMVRLVILAMNLMLGLWRKPVRAAIRPAAVIDRIARANGLAPHVAHDVGPPADRTAATSAGATAFGLSVTFSSSSKVAATGGWNPPSSRQCASRSTPAKGPNRGLLH